MEKTTFLILLVTYFIIFGMKRTILVSLHRNNKLKWLSQEVTTYIFAFLFVLLMIIGVLFTVTDDYSNVNEGFEKVRNPIENQRPHRYFDVNTYSDKE
ncbi:MAG: hypothetical protein KAJ49_08790 [Arcobacteraceae bacterium]|nr:hypothetical protein [Arcobacteraceae bacterium]